MSATELKMEDENRLVLLAGSGMALRQAVKQVIKWYPEMDWAEKSEGLK